MKPWQRQHRWFMALLLSVFCLVGTLSVRYDRSWDLTLNQRNQLSETSLTVVSKLRSPVHVDAFTRGNPKVKRLISRLLTRYKYHGDFHWDFKNPDTEMDAVRQYGINRDGELLLTYQGQTVRVEILNETAITRGLYRLLQGKTRRAVFVAGHGEHSFKPNAPDGMDVLKQRLKSADIEVLQIDLTISNSVPKGTDVLVLAAPKHALKDNEVQAIANYLNKDGRLLWLASQEHASAQPALSRLLGIRFADGTLMGVSAKTYGLDNATYVPLIPTAKNPAPLLAGIDTLVILPEASPIVHLPTESAENWQAQIMLSITGNWLLNNNNNISNSPAPITLGMSLTPSDVRKRSQVMLIGDADFATNRFIGQGQNGDFAVNILRKLAAPDVGNIVIANEIPRPVVLSKNALAYLALSMSLGLPLLILLLSFITRLRERP